VESLYLECCAARARVVCTRVGVHGGRAFWTGVPSRVFVCGLAVSINEASSLIHLVVNPLIPLKKIVAACG